MIKHLNNKIQNAIQIELFKAKSSIRIAVSWFTNELLLQPLILKLQCGVSVELIINDDEINKGGENSLDFSDFISNGGKLMWNTSKYLMHEKFCIIDDRIVITGSYNWTNKAEFNHEDVTFFYDEPETTLFYNKNFRNLSNNYQKADSSLINKTNTIRYEVKGCIVGDFFVDRNGAKYSKDKKILIKGANVEKYVVDADTEIIGEEAFSNCNSLDTIVLNNVIEIKDHAFLNCSSLQSLVIPDSVTNIKPNAFQGCKNIRMIKVSQNNPIYDSRDNSNAVIETYANKLVIACNYSEIPPSVTEIGERAFSGCELLRNIVLPDTISTIRERAFSDCKLLQGMVLPDSIKTIESYAFERCKTLKSIVLSNSLTSIKEGTFYECSSLQGITIPDNVETIAQDAFFGCKSLRSILIPKSVISIDSDAFSLSGYYAEDPIALERVVVDKNNKVYDSREECNAIIETAKNKLLVGSSGTTIIPDSIQTIGNYAFSGCELLKRIEIPSSVTSIEECAFSSCSLLESIIIPTSVTTIGENAFKGCASLKVISIPTSVTTIGNFAFDGCISLERINLPNTISILGAYVFRGCKNLINVALPRSVTRIFEGTFSGCTKLSFLTIPQGIISIGKRAFQYCSSLKNISIPDSVRIIENDAFYGCSSLENIKIPNRITTIGKNAFKDCSSIKKVTLPSTIDCSELGFEIDNMVADSIVYSDLSNNSPITKGGNQEVNFSYSNISRFNTIDIKLNFRNCDKQYICFGKEKYLLNKLQEIVGPSKNGLQLVHRIFIVGLLHKENLEISILVSPMRKFVFKIDNSPKFEWQGFDFLGTLKDKKQFWANLLIEGCVKENQNNNRCYSHFEKDEIIDFSLNNVSIGFDPNYLQRRWIDRWKWRACGRFIFFELSNNNELSTNKDKRKRLLHIMTFHKSGVLVDEEDPKYPLVTDRIVDNYSSEVGQFFEKCPSVLVFVAALIGHKLRCIDTKKYRIAGYDLNSKNGVDYDGRHSQLANFSKFEFIGPKPIIREEWLGNDGDRKAAEYIIDNLGTQSFKCYSLSNVKILP